MDDLMENLPLVYSHSSTEFNCRILACGIDSEHSNQVLIEDTKTKQQNWCSDAFVHIDWVGA